MVVEVIEPPPSTTRDGVLLWVFGRGDFERDDDFFVVNGEEVGVGWPCIDRFWRGVDEAKTR